MAPKNISTLEYLIAEQDGLREQDGILSIKVKRAGWNFTIKKSREQNFIPITVAFLFT